MPSLPSLEPGQHFPPANAAEEKAIKDKSAIYLKYDDNFIRTYLDITSTTLFNKKLNSQSQNIKLMEERANIGEIELEGYKTP